MRWILFIISLPAVIISWLFVSILWICQAVNNLEMEPYGILRATWRPWVSRRWRYSNSIGRATIYQQNSLSDRRNAHRVTAHENVHIKQGEDEMLKAFIAGSIVGLATWNLWWFIGIWSSGILWLLFGYLGSALRYGKSNSRHIYRYAEHELSAYAQTDLDHNGYTWLERYEDA